MNLSMLGKKKRNSQAKTVGNLLKSNANTNAIASSGTRTVCHASWGHTWKHRYDYIYIYVYSKCHI